MESKGRKIIIEDSDDDPNIPIVSSKFKGEYFDYEKNSNEESESNIIDEFYNDLKQNKALEYDYHDENQDEPWDPNIPIEINSDNECINSENDDQEGEYNEDQFENMQDDQYDSDNKEGEIDYEEEKTDKENEMQNQKSEPIIFNNIYKPRKKTGYDIDDIIQPCSNPKFSVLKNIWVEHKNSIFLNLEKIEKESIYDSVKVK